jgi:hypothetical protein
VDNREKENGKNRIAEMTREELEAVIWRHGVRSAVDVQAILLAADWYATAQCADAVSETTAQSRRRAVLSEATRPRTRKEAAR